MNKTKTVIIGIDGVPYSLLKNYADQEIMPNFKQLLTDGTFTPMQSSIPEISSVSWSSIITGKNPGQHNIYGFTDLIPNTYTTCFPNLLTLKAQPFWQQANNKKHVIINVPQTYPAQKLNGFHISGFVSPDLEKAVYPNTYLQQLKNIDYQIDVDSNKAHKSMDLFLTNLFTTHEKRMQLTNKLWNEINWDTFMLVFTGSDRIEHFLMDAYQNTDHPYHKKFVEYFQKVDQAIGAITQKLSEDDTLIMLSDHGMETIKVNVNLNTCLQQQKLLTLKENHKNTYNQIQKNTMAFAMDPGRIYLNKQNKYPRGSVTPKNEDDVKEQLISIFNDLTYNGQKVIKKILPKEEIYHGPYTRNAPDLVLLPNSGFSLRGTIKNKPVFEKPDKIKGMHTQHDAFFYLKNKAHHHLIPENPTVEDVVPILNQIQQ